MVMSILHSGIMTTDYVPVLNSNLRTQLLHLMRHPRHPRAIMPALLQYAARAMTVS